MALLVPVPPSDPQTRPVPGPGATRERSERTARFHKPAGGSALQVEEETRPSFADLAEHFQQVIRLEADEPGKQRKLEDCAALLSMQQEKHM